MLTAGIEYHHACAEYYMLLVEWEYIKEEDKLQEETTSHP